MDTDPTTCWMINCAAAAVAGVAVRSLPPAVVGHFDVQMARFGP
jgi:hypothetical protein